MQERSRAPRSLHRSLGLVLGVTLALAACDEEPAPARLTGFVPAEPSVTASQTIDIRVEYEANDAKLDAFEWTADAGEIEGNGKPEITYRAPDAAGDYKLTVTTTTPQEGLPDLTLDTVVKVLPAPEPVTSEAPAGEPSQAPESADTAERAPAETQADAGQTGAATPNAGQTAAEAARAAVQGAAPEAAEAGEQAAAAAQSEVESTAQDVAARSATGGQTAPQRSTDQRAPEQKTAAARSSDEPAPAGTATREPAADQGSSTAARTGPAQEATAAPDHVDAIVDRGRFTAAVQIDFEPFSFADEAGRRVGFDIDMMREFARRWLGDGGAVTFMPVTSERRIPALQEGRADLIAAALTKTPERQEAIDFSQTYFKDGQRILVAEDADIAGPCDLAGKKVAVVSGTTSLDNIKAEATACGFDIEADLVVFDLHDRAAAALLAGEVEAFTSDAIVLEHYAKGQPLKVVGNHFSEEPYGIGVPKGEERLRRLVDLSLAQMDQDGTYAAIYQKWFGDALSPYPLQAAVDPGDPELMALATTDVAAIFEPVAEQAAPGDYVVQPGDTLSKIAGKVYGDVAPGAWRRIWEANKAAIGDNPNRIEAGMRLTIPATV